MHALRGQTIGKMLCRVVVRDLTLQRISFFQAVRRDLVPGAATIAMLVAQYAASDPQVVDQVAATLNSFFVVWTALELVTMFFSDRRRALHDLIAGTVVVRVG
jgi:uncharacterized RDD family membrane protein YckC